MLAISAACVLIASHQNTLYGRLRSEMDRSVSPKSLVLSQKHVAQVTTSHRKNIMLSWLSGLSFVRRFTKPKIVFENSSWLLCVDVRDRQHVAFNTSGILFTRDTAGLAAQLRQQLKQVSGQVKLIQELSNQAGTEFQPPKELQDMEVFAKFLIQSDIAIKRDGTWWPCQLIDTTTELNKALDFGTPHV